MNEESIFIEALQKQTPEGRAAFLDQACADAELRHSVELLLKAHDKAGPFLQAFPQNDPTIDQHDRERPGTLIGPYKLLQQIGEGGMGTVFMAEQTQPVQRKVALKIIKPGMDTRQVIARFEAERQALAMMDHLNIARVLDVGATDSGRPYFVMELVHGVPITKYCDDNHLTPRERLELFVPVCQAIQHAHQKGIIHRDIKPSNILVTLYDGKPVPKVIDFGVAKATEQPLTERTLFTQYGTMVGTLEYMSPEQAEMSALGVDTRSDIYSLGVLLYELLTGSTPLSHKRVKEAAYAEILRMIKEEEPPRPSTRLSDSGEALASISAQRHMEPAKLTKLMRGELDWIVMKTLEKDRNRRYDTASAFATDVQRYLHDETVQACPPSAGYRFRKFARRNKRALASAAILGVMLLATVGAVAGSIGWVMRDRAARQLVVNDIAALALADADEKQEQGRWPEALAAVQRAEAALAGGGSEDLKRTVRERRKDLEMVERLEGIRLQERLANDVFFGSARADGEYASAFREYGFDVESLPAAEAANRLGAGGIRVELAAALDDWAMLRRGNLKKEGANWKPLLAVARTVDPDAFRNRLRDALEQHDRNALVKLAAADSVNALPARSLVLLANALGRLGAVVEGLAVLTKAQQQYPGDFWINMCLACNLRLTADRRADRAVEYSRAALAVGPQNPIVHLALGNALYDKGLLDEAIAAYRQTIRLKPDLAKAHHNLGVVLGDKGDWAGAIAAHEKAIALKPDYALAHSNLGVDLHHKGDLAGAIAAYQKAIALKPDLAEAHYNLGVTLEKKGDLPGAIAAYQKAIALKPDYAEAYNALGVTLGNKGDLPGAIAACQKAIALKPDQAEAHRNLGVALEKKGDLPGAIAAYQKAIALKPDSAEAHNALGVTLGTKGDLPGAIAAFQKAIALKPDYAEAHDNLGVALGAKGLLDEAIACQREAIRLKPDYALAHYNLGVGLGKKEDPPGAIAAYKEAVRLKPDDAQFHYNLGTALQDKGDLVGAIATYQKAIALKPDYAEAHNNLGTALKKKGDLVGAIAEFQKAIALKPDYAEPHSSLGIVLEKKGDLPGAIAAYQKAIALKPDYAGAHNNLAWLLATCADPKSRDPSRAVQLAQKAVKLAPQDGNTSSTLGAAQYRAGAWEAAVTALEKSRELRKGGDSLDWFFLAMARWRLGDKEQARKWYDQAVLWMDKNKPQDEELRRFRAEAAELLQLPEPPKEENVPKKEEKHSPSKK